MSNVKADSKVSIIIVNYNSWDILLHCLNTVREAAARTSFDILIIDNNSPMQKPAWLQFQGRDIRLLQLGHNVGFAGAVNIGIQISESPYVLLLNPDTQLGLGSLDLLVDFLDTNPAAAIVGPHLVQHSGKTDMACHRMFPRYRDLWYVLLGMHLLLPRSKEFARFNLSYLDPNVPIEVDIVSGGCMLVRRSAIEQVGLLDEDFFLYGEDTDWCYRFRLAGWKVYYHPLARVLHRKGAAMARSGWRPAIEFYRSIFVLYMKHICAKTSLPLNVLFVVGFTMRAGIGIVERRVQVQRRNRANMY